MSRPSRGALMRRHEGGTGPAPAGVVRSCTPGRTPEQPRRLLSGRLGSGHRGTRKREKPVARWTGAFLLLASALARHAPSFGGRERETGRPQARPNLGPLKLACLTLNMTNAPVRAWHAPLPTRCRAGKLRSARALESDERELPEGRHRAALDETYAAVTFGPARQAIPAEFRPPAE